ncbi:MAG: glycosyltransferase family 4 protein [Sandarakinorhabdus sp.]|nr:glycosyltransferase family 4 protein [Sandarakinorhabdus sp.]
MRSIAAARPRITHVVRQFWPQNGGLEESVLQLCRTLRRDFDADIDVVTLDRTFSDGVSHPPVDSVDGIPVRRIGFRGSRRYPLAPDIFDATSGADVIHVHAIDFFFDALALARPLRRIPMVASTHGGFFHTQFAARLKKVYFATATRAACRAYDLVGASSIADAETFRAIAGDRVKVIENGVDITKWAGAGARDFAPVMIAIGRWSSNKNLAALFPLLRELRRTRPDWRLLIAGKAYDVSRENLDEWASAQGVSDAVEIHDAPETAALGQLIGRASFFVSLSDYEGFGISVVEGLSAGLVPILSDIANYRVFVDRAGIGANVDSDPAGAARQVAALAALVAADPPSFRRRAMAAAARYEWSAVAARWGSVYAAALAGKNRGRIRAEA